MKEFIKNRKGQKIAIITDILEGQKGLAFVMHGLSGHKEQAHIQAMADAFKEKGHTVIRFDTTNTLGESDGNIEDATTTNYFEDLEDVISWAKSQEWYQEPFCLVGHSLGGICIGLYAENHPEEIKGLAPIATTVSGELSLKIHAEEVEEWKKTGWVIRTSKTRPGVTYRLPWSHMEDRLKYNLLEKANKLTMPVLLIVGDNDRSCTLDTQKFLYDKLPGRKELHIIKNAPHTFREEKHLKEIKDVFLKWIDSLDY